MLITVAGSHTHTHRFTEFLSGHDHVTPQQRVEHDWSFVVDDSDESDTVDYSDREDPVPSPHR